MTTDPKFPPDISFARFGQIKAFDAYIIDGDTIRDLLGVIEPKTASQAYRRAKLLEILEENSDGTNQSL